MLSITHGADEALTMLRDQVDDLPDGGGLRITTEAGENGDTGFAIQLVEAAADDDVVVDGHPLPVFLDAETAALLNDVALDGHAHGDHVHFGFVAPGETLDDGHGHSHDH